VTPVSGSILRYWKLSGLERARRKGRKTAQNFLLLATQFGQHFHRMVFVSRFL